MMKRVLILGVLALILSAPAYSGVVVRDDANDSSSESKTDQADGQFNDRTASNTRNDTSATFKVENNSNSHSGDKTVNNTKKKPNNQLLFGF